MKTGIVPETVVKRNPEMITNEVDGELVMMSIENGEYYGLDEIGSRIWELIETPLSLKELVTKLIEEFEVTEEECMADTLDFISELNERNLVLVVE